MIRLVALLVLVPALFAEPITPRLDSLKNVTNVYKIESGGKLFVSSNDNNEILSNIYFSFDGKNVSAATIAKMYINSTEKKDGLIVNSPTLTVINLNSVLNTKLLKGSFYVTTAAQATDVNLSVFDNFEPVIINNEQGSKTLVIFNMYKYDNDPQRPDYHGLVKYTVKDNFTYSFNMYFEVPLHRESDVFFQNPIEFLTASKTVRHFFPVTESLPVNTQIFHIKVSGACSINLSTVRNRSKSFLVSSSTTTGLLSTTNDNYLNQTVIFRADLNKRGYTYIQHIGHTTKPFQVFLSGPDKVEFFSVYAGGKEFGNYMETQLFAEMALSGPANVGQFFAQYVVIEGTEDVPTTRSSGLETTTKSSPAMTWIPIVSLMISRILQ